MSKKITLVVQKDKTSTISQVPYKYLSMKQRQHFLEYYLSHIYINNNNHIT